MTAKTMKNQCPKRKQNHVIDLRTENATDRENENDPEPRHHVTTTAVEQSRAAVY